MTTKELGKMLYEIHVDCGSYAGGKEAFPWIGLSPQQREHWVRTAEGVVKEIKKAAGPVASVLISKILG